MSPMTPESEIMPSFACVVRMPSMASSMDRSYSPSEADSRSEVTEVTTTTGPSSSSRRDRLVQLLNLYKGGQSKAIFIQGFSCLSRDLIEPQTPFSIALPSSKNQKKNLLKKLSIFSVMAHYFVELNMRGK